MNSNSFARAARATPAIEAAVSNAMLDVVSRSRNVPIYQFLGGPTRFEARGLARLEGSNGAAVASPLERAKRRGYRAFTMPVLLRDAMIPFQEYVNRVRQSVVAIQAQGGTGAEWVLAGAAGLAPGDAATVAKALELAMPAVSLSLVRQLRTRQLSPAAATAMSHLPLIAATLAHSRIIAATL